MENFVYLTIHYICSKLRLSQLRQLNINPWKIKAIHRLKCQLNSLLAETNEGSIVANIQFTKLFLFAFMLRETQQCGLSRHLLINAEKTVSEALN